jgi:hypothetical protein
MAELGKIYRTGRLTPFPAWVLLLAAFVCFSGKASAQERPWSVSPCELLKHPGMYDETMVSVPGLVLYGTHEFSSHGYDCPDDYGILRLEFGGNPADPKDQFRLPQARLEAGTVPLKKDADYETMQRVMKSIDASGRTQMVRATLIGRFFAGPAVGTKSGEIKHSHAHLVISEIELVSNKPEDSVDFSPESRLLPPATKGCSVTALSVPTRDEADKLQRLSREPSENLDFLSDSQQVTARAIASQENGSPEEIAGKLRVLKELPALREYAWTSADGLRSYSVTVSRPYWLLPSTFSADAIIWIPKRILLTTCAARAAR